jgi:acetyl esterase/lipase
MTIFIEILVTRPSCQSGRIAPILFACSLLAPVLPSPLIADDKSGPPAIALWPHEAPGSEGRSGEERVVHVGERHVSNIHNPSLTPFLPPKDKSNGAALIVCPGGGHRFLSIDHEGYDVARWLNEQGIAAFVLKYRLANEPGSTYKVDVDALADVRRAVRLVRSRAAEWGIDPGRLGVMGFSAGGDLAMLSGTRFERARADASDPIDRLDSRPDFLVLIYAGFRPNTIHVTKETPPAFLMVADDDRFCAPGTIEFYQALKKAGVSGELHVYARGGHGFGMRKRPLPITSWTARLHDWMDERGYLKPRD